VKEVVRVRIRKVGVKKIMEPMRMLTVTLGRGLVEIFEQLQYVSQ